MNNLGQKQIGDYKTPNKYWVSICNDFYYYNKEVNGYDWVSDKTKDFKFKGKVLKMFNTYKEAREYFDAISIGDFIDKIQVNNKTIEDRITGQLCEEVKIEERICPCCKHKQEEDYFFNEDLQFTRKELEKRGIEFI